MSTLFQKLIYLSYYDQDEKIPYELEKVEFFNLVRPLTSVQGFTAFQKGENGELNFHIVFQGSTSIQDWILNLAAFTTPVMHEQSRVFAMAHKGFVQQYTRARKTILNRLKLLDVDNIYITGHSLGGAIGAICLHDLYYNEMESAKLHLTTFGCPKVGNEQFNKDLLATEAIMTHFIHKNDIVTKIPWWLEALPGDKIIMKRSIFPLSVSDHFWWNY